MDRTNGYKTCRKTFTGGDTIMLYIASPYSHEDAVVRRKRYNEVVGVTAKLTLDGWKVYSPIVHSHPLVEYAASMPTHDIKRLKDKDHNFWLIYDKTIMRLCDRLVIVLSSGWETSKGLKQEVSYFKGLHRLMAVVSPDIVTLNTFAELHWRHNIMLPVEREV